MLQKVSNLIIDIARKEDLILRRVGRGVLMIPELAFTHAVGREIAMNAESIFGSSKVIWQPEKCLSQQSGRTDLVFENQQGDGGGLAIEFKMPNTSHSYQKDVLKLKKIPSGYEKIFCALIDAYPDDLKNDSRIRAVEELDGVTPIFDENRKFHDFFSTITDTASQLCCVVGIWQVE